MKKKMLRLRNSYPLLAISQCVLLLVSMGAVYGFSTHPGQTKYSYTSMSRFVAKNSSADMKSSDEWRRRAAKLREEAASLESSLDPNRRRRTSESHGDVAALSSMSYDSINDSVWVLSYRFSSQPEVDSEESDENLESRPRPVSFGGKLVLKFRADGYTTLISHKAGSGVARLDVTKAWGWDVERNDEGKDFLNFSVDTNVPASDGSPILQRFYFQAEKERNGKSIMLSDGTVTVKQDVVKSRSWGFLSPKGILAEFRYVGNFVAKPIREERIDSGQ